MRYLCEALSPALKSIHQQEYYTTPRFHASLGWALLHKARQTTSPDPQSIPRNCAADSVTTKPPNERATSSQEWPTISCLPQELITALNRKYSEKLSSLNDAFCSAEAVTLKIGKEIFTWRFA